MNEERGEPATYLGPALRPDQVIADKYRVVRILGAGGMGQVAEVEHSALGKRFALKLIRPDRWDGPLEARFRREARALGRVSSPRVAEVTDFGVDQAHGPYYVMELVDGEPLDVVIRKQGALSRERALELAIGLGEALCDVHAAGLVHRDVKPANIGICPQGPVQVRLLDFGLAAMLDDRLGSGVTESQRVVGSLPYMAPEQFHGDPPSQRMDIWALGVVLYEMLTGRVPFEAPSTAALIHKILNAPIPLHEPTPRHAAGVLSRLMAKEPAARVQSAKEAVTLLRQELLLPAGTSVLAETGQATIIDPGPRSEPVPAAVQPAARGAGRVLIGAGALLLGAAVAVWLWPSAPPPSTPPRVVQHAAQVEDPPHREASPAHAPAPQVENAPVAEQPAPQVPPVRRPRVVRAVPTAEPSTTDEPPTAPPPPPAWNGNIIESRTP